jgi:hypothetical protein
MTRTLILVVLLLATTMPLLAQTSGELGVIAGASRRFVDDAPPAGDAPLLDEGLSLSNGFFDLYWAMKLDDATRLKFKVGRIESPVAFAIRNEGDATQFRRDAEGEVQHASIIVDYRFDEIYGSTGLFGGLGVYRHSAPQFGSSTDFGFQLGVNADFPVSRRYGLVLEAAYHWTQADFSPRYLTVGAGLRIAY